VSSTRLMDCAEPLQLAFAQILADFREQTGHDLVLTCTHRSVDEQARLYAQGRTTPGPIVTQLDGTQHRSKHNLSPAQALDVAVVVAGKVSWSPDQYSALGPLCEKYGVVWGGSWPHFKDMPHIELPDAV